MSYTRHSPGFTWLDALRDGEPAAIPGTDLVSDLSLPDGEVVPDARTFGYCQICDEELASMSTWATADVCGCVALCGDCAGSHQASGYKTCVQCQSPCTAFVSVDQLKEEQRSKATDRGVHRQAEEKKKIKIVKKHHWVLAIGGAAPAAVDKQRKVRITMSMEEDTGDVETVGDVETNELVTTVQQIQEESDNWTINEDCEAIFEETEEEDGEGFSDWVERCFMHEFDWQHDGNMAINWKFVDSALPTAAARRVEAPIITPKISEEALRRRIDKHKGMLVNTTMANYAMDCVEQDLSKVNVNIFSKAQVTRVGAFAQSGIVLMNHGHTSREVTQRALFFFLFSLGYSLSAKLDGPPQRGRTLTISANVPPTSAPCRPLPSTGARNDLPKRCLAFFGEARQQTNKRLPRKARARPRPRGPLAQKACVSTETWPTWPASRPAGRPNTVIRPLYGAHRRMQGSKKSVDLRLFALLEVHEFSFPLRR